MLCHRRAVVLYCTILLLFWLLCLRLYVLSKGQHTAMTVLDGQYSSRLDIAQRSGFVYDRYLQLLAELIQIFKTFMAVCIIKTQGNLWADIFSSVCKEVFYKFFNFFSCRGAAAVLYWFYSVRRRSISAGQRKAVER